MWALEGGRSLGQPRAVLRVHEVHHITSLSLGAKDDSGAFHELEQIWGRVDVSDRLGDLYSRPAPLLVVTPHLCSRHLPAALVAGVLAMPRTTPPGGHEGPGRPPGVVVDPELALAQHAVEPRLVRVAQPLMAVQIVPARELVMAEAAGEPGTRLLPHEELLLAPLAGSAAEGRGGLLQGYMVTVFIHAGARLTLHGYLPFSY